MLILTAIIEPPKKRSFPTYTPVPFTATFTVIWFLKTATIEAVTAAPGNAVSYINWGGLARSSGSTSAFRRPAMWAPVPPHDVCQPLR
jgi:hypothetical protein